MADRRVPPPWQDRLRRRALLAWRRTRVRLRVLARAWQRSLRVRVSVTTVAVGLVALLTLGAALSGQVRDSLYDARVDEVLTDAAVRAEQAQSAFDNSNAARSQDVVVLGYDVLNSLATTAGAASVLLLRPPGQGTQFPELASDNNQRALITAELREAVRGGDRQMWQAVAIKTGDGEVPGIAAGTMVTLPLVGASELYFVYSLSEEQATLDLLQRVLLVGALALVLLLLVMTWYLTKQVLTPVQQAANTAGRLADGLLDERMTVRGVDELAVLARSFNEMAQSIQDQIERLAHLSQMQQRFVSDVSHELRTPLTTIRMASEVLNASRDDFGPIEARSAELLATQLDRFESLLADLLEISRFDAGAATLEVEETNMVVAVERVIDIVEPLAEQRGSPVARTLPEVPVRVDMDTRRVERVLRNLLVNAVEHGEGKPIEVTMAANARAVSVVVRDHGIGMTPAAAARVFDRFWRADPARTRTLGGTGLGLAISLEDAHLHGGTLEAWGSPGEGAAFRLTLPLRAGLEVREHPLPLVPPREQSDPVEERDPAGPHALPDDFMVEVSE
ncbi:MtrAB system histidine kinase MtrB [Pseudactinotalea terrae]|uniref:MtrAB system histidine kinase MtrB n=1 Tax=Pseudactinotalea terrae TaxID=1743262 RepID=UPI001F4FEB52|nr:MtrAB system histidine kinase MtrB [Pseudactinotalea terrae]